MVSEAPADKIRKASIGHRARGLVVMLMGCLAIVAAFVAGHLALFLVGALLIACGILELLETFQASDSAQRSSTYLSGMASIVAGSLLMARPELVLRGLSLFIAITFLISGFGKLLVGVRPHSAADQRRWAWLVGSVNVLLAAILITQWPVSGLGFVVILSGIRMLTTGWAMISGRLKATEMPTEPVVGGVHPDRRLGLPAHAEFDRLEKQFQAEDVRRRSIDAYWCAMLVVIFFAIHVGRMSVEWNAVGMISPLVAALGDVATALLIAFGIVLPGRLAWRKMTRPYERWKWKRVLARLDQGQGSGWLGKMNLYWLRRRNRFAHRLHTIRRSPLSAVHWGLHVGLPVTAILIAVNPIWGFSWFFNSESWAAEVWNRWAEARTDTWREQMILAVKDVYQPTGISEDQLFRVAPANLIPTEDFSFLVIGDPGEGDASQYCLKDQYLSLGRRPDVKFLVISSDVIYPTGAMSDYESKFYLPFKGFSKPIYAIPGNHDWYDALEGFAANFLEADAAKASIHARVKTDARLTSTTDKRIDNMIQVAARMRQDFGVSAGHQRGPFFEMQTPRFSLIAVDTGVLRDSDVQQWKWLEAALERAKGTFKFVILGHPLYAGGRYQGGNDSFAAPRLPGLAPPKPLAVLPLGDDDHSFAAIHQLLRKHQVEVVMAGDTHYFEHYQEHYSSADQKRTMHHFVNGGGGAYMSIGTPLDWPTTPAVPDCAFFPRTDFLIAKLDREMPRWKSPLWFWVKRMGAWPLTSEFLGGAFDYNRAPYLQSFVEVRVENSAQQVRIIVHGAMGALQWKDMQCYGAVNTSIKNIGDAAEFVIPLPPPRN